MKTRYSIALSLALATLSLSAVAHDPKLHKQQGAAAPDCSQMKNMDMSKMDMNDPVMKAMHQKCKDSMNRDGMHKKKTPPSTSKDKK